MIFFSITKSTKAILYGAGKGSEMGWDGVDLFSYASESLVNTTYVGISLFAWNLF